jgi:type IV secretory pathway VirB2 component (pilin)
MYNRLFKEGKIATLFGLIILVFAGAALWFGKVDYLGFSGMLGTVLILFRVKDTALGIKPTEGS